MKTIYLFFLMAMLQVANGQGYELTFGGPKTDFGDDIVKTDNGDLIIVGYSESFGEDNDLDVYTVRIDVDGVEVWSKIYDEGFTEHGYAIIATSDGGFLIAGDRIENQFSSLDGYLLKIDGAGELLWSQSYGLDTIDEQFFSIIPAIDGGYIALGRSKDAAENEDIYIVKVDENGGLVWETQIGTPAEEEGNDIVRYQDGYIIAGKASRPGDEDNLDAYIAGIDIEGNINWEKFYGGNEMDEAKSLIITSDNKILFTGFSGNNSNVYVVKTDVGANGADVFRKTFGGEYGDEGWEVVETEDNHYVIAGYSEVTNANIDILLAKINGQGNLIWERHLGREDEIDFGSGLVKQEDGGFALVGYTSLFNAVLINDVTVLVTDALGNINSTWFEGNVFHDVNENCDFDDNEDLPLKDWLIKAESEHITYYGTSDENGHYSILVDTGNYQISILPQNELWEPCIDDYNMNVTGLYDTLQLHFPINTGIGCPYMEVDVSAPILSDCEDVIYTVEYCNNGTQTAFNAYVEVTIDSLIGVNETSIPIIAQEGNLYSFNLGDIPSGQCGSFEINATLTCEGFITGLAHEVVAHIFPDFNCNPPDSLWDGSSIRVLGNCEGDSIQFNIKNIGDNPTEDSIDYFIVEDFVMLLKDETVLDPGEELPISIPATGATYRLVANQAEGHPGNSYPTVAVEGCASGEGVVISTGFVNMFPEDDNNPFISIDVQESFSSIETPGMRGYPKGYGQEHLIPTETDISYHLLFSNTGTDTINRVVIRDTLPPSLDLTTVSPGAASHPYSFQIYGNGVVKFTFENINLPPGNEENDLATLGFVKFRVSQNPDTQVGTTIENRAAVYMGFDVPVLTNTVYHTIGGNSILDFVTVTGTENVYVPDIHIQVYPNPFVETATFKIIGQYPYNKGTFSLFDVNGRLVRQQSFTRNRFEFSRNQLSSGIYFYQLEADGQLLNSGKIIID